MDDAPKEAAPPGLWTVEDEHLEGAAEAVRRIVPHLPTPLVAAPGIHPRVWLKLETGHAVGSFKVRGAVARLAVLDQAEREAGVVTCSAGNHGLGVAWACAKLGLRATVFVPKGAPDVKVQGMVRLGAEVVRTAVDGYDDAEAIAVAAAAERGATFVSPYDDPWVAAGNGGTVGLEIFGAMPRVGTVVVPVGGGGLLAGLAAARDREAPETRIVGVQAAASPGMTRSIEEGRAIEHLEYAETLAEGLEGGVSPSSYEAARRARVAMHLVSEAEIAEAMRAAHRRGDTVEGSAAVALAWAAAHAAEEPGEDPVVVVVTGRNVDRAVVERILAGASGKSS